MSGEGDTFIALYVSSLVSPDVFCSPLSLIQWVFYSLLFHASIQHLFILWMCDFLFYFFAGFVNLFMSLFSFLIKVIAGEITNYLLFDPVKVLGVCVCVYGSEL